jgi:hypothetical protein
VTRVSFDSEDGMRVSICSEDGTRVSHGSEDGTRFSIVSEAGRRDSIGLLAQVCERHAAFSHLKLVMRILLQRGHMH